MQKVWITGAAGQIGTAINDVLDPLSMEILNTDLDELDITQTDEVLNFGAVNRPNIIINCAAVTDVALCEKEPELAFRVNALGARNLSIAAQKAGAKMVQLSTDDVFDGLSTRPYTEFDTTNPLTIMDVPSWPVKIMSKNLPESILSSAAAGFSEKETILSTTFWKLPEPVRHWKLPLTRPALPPAPKTWPA